MPLRANAIKARFMAKVTLPNESGCMLWRGTTSRFNGYGRFYDGHRMIYAHRFAYEVWVGPIPDELQIDHLCRVRNCVAPAHLEPVTAQVNTLRGYAVSALNAAKTHCDRGHPLSGANLSQSATNDGRRRRCLACARLRQQAYRAQKKRAAAA